MFHSPGLVSVSDTDLYIHFYSNERMTMWVNRDRQTWPVLNSVSRDRLVISSSRSSPFGFETRAVVSAVVRPSGSVRDQSDVVYRVAVEYSQSRI